MPCHALLVPDKVIERLFGQLHSQKERGVGWEGSRKSRPETAVQAGDPSLPADPQQLWEVAPDYLAVPARLHVGFGHIEGHGSRPAQHACEASAQEEVELVGHGGDVGPEDVAQQVVAPEEEGVERPVPHDLGLKASEHGPDALPPHHLPGDVPRRGRPYRDLRLGLDDLAGQEDQGRAAARDGPHHEGPA